MSPTITPNAIIFVEPWTYTWCGATYTHLPGTIMLLHPKTAYILHNGGLALPHFYGIRRGEFIGSKYYKLAHLESEKIVLTR